MNKSLREELKKEIRSSIKNYILKYRGSTFHPLDILLPKHRKTRSIIGGLETSMGTKVWEPIAKTLAKYNNFEINEENILKPKPYPRDLARLVDDLKEKREQKDTWIDINECIAVIREECKRYKNEIKNFVAPPSGHGVDVYLVKNGLEYAFDIKTVQPNVGSIKRYNNQILNWYAFRLFKDPEAKISCQIAYPYNPKQGDFWLNSPHNEGLLEPKVDAVVENEFWNFCSGFDNTYEHIIQLFEDLRDEGFGKEISDDIDRLNML